MIASNDQIKHELVQRWIYMVVWLSKSNKNHVRQSNPLLVISDFLKQRRHFQRGHCWLLLSLLAYSVYTITITIMSLVCHLVFCSDNWNIFQTTKHTLGVGVVQRAKVETRHPSWDSTSTSFQTMTLTSTARWHDLSPPWKMTETFYSSSAANVHSLEFQQHSLASMFLSITFFFVDTLTSGELTWLLNSMKN